MPNIDVDTYFFTAAVPVCNEGIVEQGGMKSSPIHVVREVLETLPTALQSHATEKIGLNSPFSRNLRTHFARLVVLDQPNFNGRDHSDALVNAITGANLLQPQPVDQLTCPYILVMIDFDLLRPGGTGDPRHYFEELWREMEPELRSIFQYCYGFDGVRDAAGFATYMIGCQIETTMPFHDYWWAPPKLSSISRFTLLAIPGAGLLLLLAALLGAFFGWIGWRWAAGILEWAGSPWVVPTGILLVILGLAFDYWLIMRKGNKPFPAAPGHHAPPRAQEPLSPAGLHSLRDRAAASRSRPMGAAFRAFLDNASAGRSRWAHPAARRDPQPPAGRRGMTTTAATPAPPLLDLADIQGGILRTYGDGFPKGRNFYLTVRDARKGRAFVEALRPRITSAARWKDPARGEPLLRTRNPRVKDIARAEGVPDYPGRVQLIKPKVTINIGFTFYGLLALGVPTRTLRGMPDEFIDGMEERAALLGDDPFLDRRDAVWRDSRGDRRVHILLTLYAQMNEDGTPCPELDRETGEIVRLCEESQDGVVLLDGVGPDKARWQDLSAVMREDGDRCWPTNKEHFGLSDGFGDPVFSGQFSGEAERLRVAGGGKLQPDQSWAPLATGEFLLGYPDEAQEIPGAAMPLAFSRNGTFMAYRKLHEDVGTFNDYIDEQAGRYARMFAVPHDEAVDTIKAKMVGRWHDGVPLMAAPTYAAWRRFNADLARARAAGDKPKLAEIALKFTNFVYASDPAGSKCPMTSHLRRANPRDTLGPTFDPATGRSQDGSAIINRRRILRRGLPYGRFDRDAPRDRGDHGDLHQPVPPVRVRPAAMDAIRARLQHRQRHLPGDRQPSGRGPSQAGDPRRSRGGEAALHLRPPAPARRAARRGLFLHPEHDGAADDRNGDHRPDLTPVNPPEEEAPGAMAAQPADRAVAAAAADPPGPGRAARADRHRHRRAVRQGRHDRQPARRRAGGAGLAAPGLRGAATAPAQPGAEEADHLRLSQQRHHRPRHPQHRRDRHPHPRRGFRRGLCAAHGDDHRGRELLPRHAGHAPLHP
ncbi:MAG: hypothetical protein WDN24_20020 [Sphingomonas sp.]